MIVNIYKQPVSGYTELYDLNQFGSIPITRRYCESFRQAYHGLHYQRLFEHGSKRATPTNLPTASSDSSVSIENSLKLDKLRED